MNDGAAVTLDPARERAWARRVLPRVSRTFAVNIRVLSGSLGDAVRTAYLLCRIADTLEDAWPGPANEIGERFDRLKLALDGDLEAPTRLAAEASRLCARPDLELVASLPAVLNEFHRLNDNDRAIIAEALGVMIGGMRRYAVRAAQREERNGVVPYLDTESELHDYCWVVAGCVGVMLTRLCAERQAKTSSGLMARRLELSPIVGEALQLTNILLDWPVDVRRGRCHVPADWLEEQGITVDELEVPADDRPRRLADRLEALARRALAKVPEYLALYPATAWRYRLFVLWPSLWALASLRHARSNPAFPFAPERPRLPRGEVRRIAVSASVTGHTQAGVLRLFEAVGKMNV
jgi:farnesyl-diphosphate farnesyltransferase